MDLASFTHAQQCLLITAATQCESSKRTGLSRSHLQHKGLLSFPDVSKKQAMLAFEQLVKQGVVTHGRYDLITISNDSIKKSLNDIFAEYQAEASGQ